MKKSFLLGLLLALCLPLAAGAEFYQYEDERGAVHFTDDPGKIPKKYKKSKKNRGDDDDQPGVTRVRIQKNRVLVPVSLSYRGKEVRGTFVLDTGAEVSTMNPAFADQLGIDPDDPSVELAYAQGIGTGVHAAIKVKLDHVLVGPNRKYDMDFVVIPAGGSADGLLGMNFLRGLRYHVNFDRGTIDWGR